MKKTVWILNHYATDHFYEMGGRHFWISDQLKKKGYDPVVFGASDLHNDERQINLKKKFKCMKTTINVPLVVVRVRSERTGGIHRVLNMIDYYRNVQVAANYYGKKYGKPDVIYAASVHPLTLIAGEKLAKKYKVPCVCEVRDLWPETMVLMNIWKKNSLVTKAMYVGEKWIYKNADALVFTMEGGKEYIKSRRWDESSGGPIKLSQVYHVNNGVDLKRFKENIEKYTLEDQDLLEKDKFIVNYTGSIRRANNVAELVETAKYLKSYNDKIKILIWGAGDFVESLCKLIDESGLDNIKYKGVIKKIYVPSVLVQGDINIYTFRDGGTKYGIDLNKCFEYLASGKPAIGNDETMFSVIRKYGCGIEEKMDAKELANAINDIATLPEDEYLKLCRSASEASKDYDFSVLTDKLIDIIESL